jgi:hypothetical protein
MGKFREHIKRCRSEYLVGTATLVLLAYAALNSDCLAKKYYLDLNGDGIQDNVKVPRITGILGVKNFYLGQKDGTGKITYKNLTLMNREDLEMVTAEVKNLQKEQREAIKEVFRQYPK